FKMTCAEAVADRAEAPGAERVEVAHAGPGEDEKVDAALANAPLQRLGPGRKRRQVGHRAETSTAPEAPSTTRTTYPMSGPRRILAVSICRVPPSWRFLPACSRAAPRMSMGAAWTTVRPISRSVWRPVSWQTAPLRRSRSYPPGPSRLETRAARSPIRWARFQIPIRGRLEFSVSG